VFDPHPDRDAVWACCAPRNTVTSVVDVGGSARARMIRAASSGVAGKNNSSSTTHRRDRSCGVTPADPVEHLLGAQLTRDVPGRVGLDRVADPAALHLDAVPGVVDRLLPTPPVPPGTAQTRHHPARHRSDHPILTGPSPAPTSSTAAGAARSPLGPGPFARGLEVLVGARLVHPDLSGRSPDSRAAGDRPVDPLSAVVPPRLDGRAGSIFWASHHRAATACASSGSTPAITAIPSDSARPAHRSTRSRATPRTAAAVAVSTHPAAPTGSPTDAGSGPNAR